MNVWFLVMENVYAISRNHEWLRKYVKPSVPAPPTTHPEPEKSWGGPETSVICPRRSANPIRLLMFVCVFEPVGPTPRYTKPFPRTCPNEGHKR